jgi:integrase
MAGQRPRVHHHEGDDAPRRTVRHEPPLQAATQASGLPPVRFHDLQHSCLSLLAQHGEPIRDLQALARHATVTFTLQHYTHHYDASARRTADARGDILPDEP